MTKIKTLLEPYPEVLHFVNQYKNYIHFIDDLVDKPETRTPANILKLTSDASILFSSDVWQQHCNRLLIIEQLINNTYADSVSWENSALQWQRVDSNVLRHAGIDMFFALILIYCGYDKLREISAEFRTNCHSLHMDNNNKPV